MTSFRAQNQQSVAFLCAPGNDQVVVTRNREIWIGTNGNDIDVFALVFLGKLALTDGIPKQDQQSVAFCVPPEITKWWLPDKGRAGSVLMEMMTYLLWQSSPRSSEFPVCHLLLICPCRFCWHKQQSGCLTRRVMVSRVGLCTFRFI